jgi:hypothetical protein
MPSVFASAQTFAGGFRADNLGLTLGGTAAAGMGIQNVQFSFSQQIAMLYEIGSNNVYFVGGRAQGSMSIGRIIGPANAQAKFIESYGDLCKPRNITFDASAGCPGGDPAINASIKYTVKRAVLQTVAVSTTANDVVINEQLQFMFVDLEYGGAA